MDSIENTRAGGGPLELLEAEFVALEPALEGSLGVMVELHEGKRGRRGASPEREADGRRFVVLQTVAGSGNVIASLTTDDEQKAYRAFANTCAHGHCSDKPWDSPVSR